MAKPHVPLPKRCLAFAQLFEAELLVELLLRFWKHPSAEDSSYRQALLHQTTEVLEDSVRGNQLMAEIPPLQMNFVAALWYVEWLSVETNPGEADSALRKNWLDAIRKSLPSCFCDHADLSEE